MPFCSGCGREHSVENRFCAGCGRSLSSDPQSYDLDATPDEAVPGSVAPIAEQTLWEGQPHGVLNPIETHAVGYELTTERLRVIRGILNRTHDDIELTRVRDVTVEQSLTQRALGIGNVTIVTTDSSAPDVFLHDIGEPHQVKEMIRQAVRQQRQRFRVRQFEDM